MKDDSHKAVLMGKLNSIDAVALYIGMSMVCIEYKDQPDNPFFRSADRLRKLFKENLDHAIKENWMAGTTFNEDVSALMENLRES